MPPKAKSKRPASPSSDNDNHNHNHNEVKATKPKKAKPTKDPVVPLDPSLPINTTFPLHLAPFPRPSGHNLVRIAAWNVCGLNACEKKGFKKYVEAEDASILVLTETKIADPHMPELDARYPYRYFGTDPNKKGYAGTAILSKIEPLAITFGLPTTDEPKEETAGRCVTLEFENTYVIGTYVVNAGSKLETLPKKALWNTAFEKYLRQLDALKPIIWTGDINCVPTSKDVRNWKTNYNKTAGCTEVEIAGLKSQLESGEQKLVDVWRARNPELEGHYTYFSYRFECRKKGIGWRLDSFILSERIIEKVKLCEIRHEVYGASDHVPIVLDCEGPL